MRKLKKHKLQNSIYANMKQIKLKIRVYNNYGIACF